MLLYEHAVVDPAVLERLDGEARVVDEERLGAVAVAAEQDGPVPEVELDVEVRGRDAARGAGAREAHHRGAPAQRARGPCRCRCAREPNIIRWSCMHATRSKE